jgi:RNA polymerase sigma factor (sigma-70 family)
MALVWCTGGEGSRRELASGPILGVQQMSEKRVEDEDSEKLADANPIDLLFEKALRQDGEAMRHLVTLLSTTYYRQIIGRLKGLGTGAHTKTIEDLFQDTLIILMKKLESGELKDLNEKHRKDVLKYFQGLCDGRLRDVVRPRKDPALKRHKTPLTEGVADRDAKIPGVQRDTEHIALIDGAMTRLEPDHSLIMKMYRNGDSYEEMAQVTGKRVETLRNLVSRLKSVLLADIVRRSDTARINFERSREEPIKVLPSWEEILEAIDVLPVEIGQAIRFVDLEHHTMDELARKLGARGKEKARARLEAAYQSLSAKLHYPFPDVFRVVGPKPKKKLHSRAEIEAAVAKLPPMYKEAFEFVHMEGHSVEELALRLDDDPERAQSRVEEACRQLSLQFKESFPDAYYRSLRDDG